MTATKFPFTVHSLAPEGITVVTRAVHQFTAKGVTLYPGDALEITEEIHKMNRDRLGASWLDLDAEAQLSQYGRQKFGRGEVPQDVIAAAKAQQHRRLAAERDVLLRNNPALAKASAAALRVAAIEAELGA